MGQLRWTNESLRWLEDIFEYIAGENPAAARATVDGLYKRAQMLREHPQIGYRYEGSEREVRVLLYGHYRIAYLVKAGGDVDILGVFHGALDLARYNL